MTFKFLEALEQWRGLHWQVKSAVCARIKAERDSGNPKLRGAWGVLFEIAQGAR